MSTENPAFSMRMLYAPSAELIDYAARLDFNWVVIGSTGHKGGQPEDNPPAYVDSHPRLRALGIVRTETVEAERERLRERCRTAKQQGLRVIYHTYEPSLPYGFEKAYPKLFSHDLAEYRRAAGKTVRGNRNLCVARPEVREVLSAKVAELCLALPELDGLMYTNNESSSTTKVWHRCDTCRDISYPKMMQFMHDTMQDGIIRSGRPVRLFYRCWGSHDHDFHYWEKHRAMLDAGFGELEGEEWLAAYVRCFKPAGLHFCPTRDNPAFAELLNGRDTAVVYKATWADTNLRHPLNPWIGAYTGNTQVCELSFEFCRDAPNVFYVMGKEMQRRAKLCARKGVDGLVAVPLCWGMPESWGENCARPSHWLLAEANLRLFAELASDPDVDLVRATQRYLEERYGEPLPLRLAELVLESEQVAADAMNVRGVRATGSSLRTFYASLLRYGPMYRDWRTRLRPTGPNVERILKEKARNVGRAERMLELVERRKNTMPARAYGDFRVCFEALLEMARSYERLHRLFMQSLAIGQGYRCATPALLHELHELSARSR